MTENEKKILVEKIIMEIIDLWRRKCYQDVTMDMPDQTYDTYLWPTSVTMDNFDTLTISCAFCVAKDKDCFNRLNKEVLNETPNIEHTHVINKNENRYKIDVDIPLYNNKAKTKQLKYKIYKQLTNFQNGKIDGEPFPIRSTFCYADEGDIPPFVYVPPKFF